MIRTDELRCRFVYTRTYTYTDSINTIVLGLKTIFVRAGDDIYVLRHKTYNIEMSEMSFFDSRGTCVYYIHKRDLSSDWTNQFTENKYRPESV